MALENSRKGKRIEQAEKSSSLLLMEHKVYQGTLVLVNREHPVRYQLPQKDLRPVFPQQPGILMEKESAGMLRKLLSHIQNGQEGIVGVSGYRTKAEQAGIFESSWKENGREFTEKYVAAPDCSEHQTGLAIDLAKNCPEIDFIRPAFPYHGVCQEFRELAAGFGFIERYAKEKQTVTGIGEEPWHFRYVGRPHAELMQREGLALEEYIGWLKQFDLERRPLVLQKPELTYKIGYVRAQGKLTEWKMELPKSRIEISGNNVDGFIITLALKME